MEDHSSNPSLSSGIPHEITLAQFSNALARDSTTPETRDQSRARDHPALAYTYASSHGANDETSSSIPYMGHAETLGTTAQPALLPEQNLGLNRVPDTHDIEIEAHPSGYGDQRMEQDLGGLPYLGDSPYQNSVEPTIKHEDLETDTHSHQHVASTQQTFPGLGYCDPLVAAPSLDAYNVPPTISYHPSLPGSDVPHVPISPHPQHSQATSISLTTIAGVQATSSTSPATGTTLNPSMDYRLPLSSSAHDVARLPEPEAPVTSRQAPSSTWPSLSPYPPHEQTQNQASGAVAAQPTNSMVHHQMLYPSPVLAHPQLQMLQPEPLRPQPPHVQFLSAGPRRPLSVSEHLHSELYAESGFMLSGVGPFETTVEQSQTHSDSLATDFTATYLNAASHRHDRGARPSFMDAECAGQPGTLPLSCREALDDAVKWYTAPFGQTWICRGGRCTHPVPIVRNESRAIGKILVSEIQSVARRFVAHIRMNGTCEADKLVGSQLANRLVEAIEGMIVRHLSADVFMQTHRDEVSAILDTQVGSVAGHRASSGAFFTSWRDTIVGAKHEEVKKALLRSLPCGPLLAHKELVANSINCLYVRKDGVQRLCSDSDIQSMADLQLCVGNATYDTSKIIDVVEAVVDSISPGELLRKHARNGAPLAPAQRKSSVRRFRDELNDELFPASVSADLTVVELESKIRTGIAELFALEVLLCRLADLQGGDLRRCILYPERNVSIVLESETEDFAKNVLEKAQNQYTGSLRNVQHLISCVAGCVRKYVEECVIHLPTVFYGAAELEDSIYELAEAVALLLTAPCDRRVVSHQVIAARLKAAVGVIGLPDQDPPSDAPASRDQRARARRARGRENVVAEDGLHASLIRPALRSRTKDLKEDVMKAKRKSTKDWTMALALVFNGASSSMVTDCFGNIRQVDANDPQPTSVTTQALALRGICEHIELVRYNALCDAQSAIFRARKRYGGLENIRFTGILKGKEIGPAEVVHFVESVSNDYVTPCRPVGPLNIVVGLPIDRSSGISAMAIQSAAQAAQQTHTLASASPEAICVRRVRLRLDKACQEEEENGRHNGTSVTGLKRHTAHRKAYQRVFKELAEEYMLFHSFAQAIRRKLPSTAAACSA